MSQPIPFNTPLVVQLAQESCDAEGRLDFELFGEKLNAQVAVPSPLFDQDAARVRKALARVNGSVLDGDHPCVPATVLTQLERAVDACGMLALGQWASFAHYVHSFQEFSTSYSVADDGGLERQARNAQYVKIAAFLRDMPDTHAPKHKFTAPLYNAWRVACVLSCPFEECGQNFHCTETQRAFCRTDY